MGIEEAKRLRKEGKNEEALKELEGLEDEEAVLLKVDILAGLKRVDEALQVIGRALDKKTTPRLLLRRSILLFRKGDREGAIRDVEEALKLDPHNPVILKNLAEVNLAAGRPEEALKHMEELLKRSNDKRLLEKRGEIIDTIKEMIRTDPDRAFVEEARLALKDDEILRAEALLRMVKKRGLHWYEVSIGLARKRGLLHEVVRLGSEALEEGFKSPNLLRSYIFSLADLGRYEEALVLMEDLVKMRSDPMVYADSAYLKMLAGELEEAEKDIDKAIGMNPRKEVLFIRKGDIVARRRGLEEAIEYYRKAVEINPLNHEAHDRLENVYSILYKGREVQDEIFR